MQVRELLCHVSTEYGDALSCWKYSVTVLTGVAVHFAKHYNSYDLVDVPVRRYGSMRCSPMIPHHTYSKKKMLEVITVLCEFS
jgi:hypothetical protein